MAASPHLCMLSFWQFRACSYNVAYNKSRLHPSSQRSKTRTTAKRFLWLSCKHGFSLLKSTIYVFQSVIRDHPITIYSCSHPYIDFGVAYSCREQILLDQHNFCQSIYMYAGVSLSISPLCCSKPLFVHNAVNSFSYWCFYF